VAGISVSAEVAPVDSTERLRRSLTLWDLILYGVIVIQPVAPMSVYGVLAARSNGHAVTAILIALAAMLLTAMAVRSGRQNSMRRF